MKWNAPPAYHPSLRFAAIAQTVAVVLAFGVDDDGTFFATVLAGWLLYWLGVYKLTKFRHEPGKPELFAVRYGPFAVFVGVFALGQYL